MLLTFLNFKVLIYLFVLLLQCRLPLKSFFFLAQVEEKVQTSFVKREKERERE